MQLNDGDVIRLGMRSGEVSFSLLPFDEHCNALTFVTAKPSATFVPCAPISYVSQATR